MPTTDAIERLAQIASAEKELRLIAHEVDIMFEGVHPENAPSWAYDLRAIADVLAGKKQRELS